MKKYLISILLIVNSCISAQENNDGLIKPRYTVDLTTMQGNVLKGLLLQVNDTSVIIYPGKRKEWNRKEAYYAVEFGFSRISGIKLKKKNGVVKGVALGGSIGLSAILATVLLNNATSKGEAVNNVVLVVPAGIIGGGYAGSKSKKDFNINGNEKAFIEFQKQIK